MLTESPTQISTENHPVAAISRERGGLDWALVTAITIIAAILRLHGLDSKIPWFDEAMSAGIARLPWSEFVRVLWRFEANMAFYYWLLHFWSAFGGTTMF